MISWTEKSWKYGWRMWMVRAREWKWKWIGTVKKYWRTKISGRKRKERRRQFKRENEKERNLFKTYSISSSANPLKACSSKHVISLLSICKLRNDVASLKIFRPIVASELCDKSLCNENDMMKWSGEYTSQINVWILLYIFQMIGFHIFPVFCFSNIFQWHSKNGYGLSLIQETVWPNVSCTKMKKKNKTIEEREHCERNLFFLQ